MLISLFLPFPHRPYLFLSQVRLFILPPPSFLHPISSPLFLFLPLPSLLESLMPRLLSLSLSRSLKKKALPTPSHRPRSTPVHQAEPSPRKCRLLDRTYVGVPSPGYSLCTSLSSLLRFFHHLPFHCVASSKGRKAGKERGNAFGFADFAFFLFLFSSRVFGRVIF